MAEVADRVAVTSKAAARSGVVTAVTGRLLRVRWDTGQETSFVPGAGALSVIARAPKTAAAAKPANKNSQRPTSSPDRTDLPRLRFHDLRHTAATLLLAENVNPKIVSEMLGHTTVGITLDLYSHVTPTMQRAAAEAMDNLCARPTAEVQE